ncbi:MAG: hypothetical protein K6C05_05275 [Anaerovibrio sp.]|uniref:hypothetical protein n=1 Tax=Anaerovibrio sp. TaxID=1872532 RepID=UPI0025ED602B|nr:hypothetical protein [Anaerovibrio sp.]MCR5176243.1 hypothetical protein [Anaerovibrio sp.]
MTIKHKNSNLTTSPKSQGKKQNEKNQSDEALSNNEDTDVIQQFFDDVLGRLKSMEGRHSIPFNELFPEAFMHQHTKAASIDNFLIEGGYDSDDESFNAIPEDEFNEYVKNNSDFNSWDDMKKSATIIYLSEKYGFTINESKEENDDTAQDRPSIIIKG